MTRTEQLLWISIVVLLLMFILGAMEQLNYRMTQIRSFTVYVSEGVKSDVVA